MIFLGINPFKNLAIKHKWTKAELLVFKLLSCGSSCRSGYKMLTPSRLLSQSLRLFCFERSSGWFTDFTLLFLLYSYIYWFYSPHFFILHFYFSVYFIIILNVIFFSSIAVLHFVFILWSTFRWTCVWKCYVLRLTWNKALWINLAHISS